MNILIVEDSNTARYVAVKTLRDLGYTQLTAVNSAEEARERMTREKFDLILLDWNMGGMSGLEFLKLIRSDPKNNAISVIMVTTVNERNNVISALKIGVQGYFFKPINAEAISAKIKEIEAKKNLNSPAPSVG